MKFNQIIVKINVIKNIDLQFFERVCDDYFHCKFLNPELIEYKYSESFFTIYLSFNNKDIPYNVLNYILNIIEKLKTQTLSKINASFDLITSFKYIPCYAEIKYLEKSKDNTVVFKGLTKLKISKKIYLRLKKIMDDTILKAKKESKILVHEHIGTIFYNKDPSKILISKNWINFTDLRGQYVLGPIISKIYSVFVNLIIDRLKNYDEVYIPKICSFKTWMKTNHLYKFGSEIYYVSRFKTRNRSTEKEFFNDILLENKLNVGVLKDNLSNPIGGLSYSQCCGFWNYLKNKNINMKKLPFLFFDYSGPSYRYEGKAIHNLERLDEFHRMELIFLGTEDMVVKEIRNIEKIYTELLNYLELSYKVYKVPSWYDSNNNKISTLDFEIYLPYKDKWLESLNVSNNHSNYPTYFNIKPRNLFSGCSGIGIDRLVYSFLCQKGFNLENWPLDIALCIKPIIEKYNNFII